LLGSNNFYTSEALAHTLSSTKIKCHSKRCASRLVTALKWNHGSMDVDVDVAVSVGVVVADAVASIA